MFKKSRIKIILSILSVLVFLLAGTLCVIYFASLSDVYQRNQEMLERYIHAYSQNGNPDKVLSKKLPIPNNKPEKYSDKDHIFRLSTFYSVAIYDNKIIDIDNSDGRMYSDEQLTNFAYAILEKQKEQGTYRNLIYRVDNKTDYILVVFMDNTVVKKSMTTLLRYTLLFGCSAIVVIFFLSVILSKRIIKPLEESYLKQKQFISDAGHELKTPISAVNTNAEMLSREIGENRWLSNIQFENQRMTSIICQLLELAKTENMIPKMANVHFSRVLMGECLSFETIAFEKGLNLSYEISEKLFVYGNEEQLRQLVSILLDNALSHSKKDGLITITLKSKHGKIHFSVENEGLEIPKEQQKMIFERFYRVDESRTGEENHYGLGLAIAKAIVASHHGDISVACSHGKIIFSVILSLSHESIP